MYNGFTESPERIEERKRRILAGYKPEATTKKAQSRLRAFISQHKQAIEVIALLVGSVLLTDFVALGLVWLAR